MFSEDSKTAAIELMFKTKIITGELLLSMHERPTNCSKTHLEPASEIQVIEFKQK